MLLSKNFLYTIVKSSKTFTYCRASFYEYTLKKTSAFFIFHRLKIANKRIFCLLKGFSSTLFLLFFKYYVKEISSYLLVQTER